MKKIAILSLSLTMLLTSGLSASSKNDDIRKGDIRDIEKFFYNQGVRDSYNEAYAAGYAQATKDALLALKRYDTLIQAREAGKYLTEKNKITSPEVYAFKTRDGSIKMKVRGCAIEKELTAEDILKAPLANAEIFTDGKGENYEKSKMKKELDASNSVHIAKRDNVESEVPMLPGNETKREKRVYDNTPTIRKALDENNIAYSTSDKKIKALFSSQSNAEMFEQEYKLK